MFDLSLVLLGAIAWVPLMLTIMVAIKLVSPGPVFFRQRRIGFLGRPFLIFKFRSMKVDAETHTHERYVELLMQRDAPLTKLDANDKRLIPFGRIFRATGLDELPQVFNVLRGEMSLVGPRPCTPNEFEKYRPDQRQRVNAPPGISGYWQVHGKNRTTFNEMIAMDLKYVREMSLCLDCAIVLRTLFVLLQDSLSAVGMVRKTKHNEKPGEVEPLLDFAPVETKE